MVAQSPGFFVRVPQLVFVVEGFCQGSFPELSMGASAGRSQYGVPNPDPLKAPKNWNQYEPITTLGKLGDYLGVPFFGSFRGSGKGWVENPNPP